MIRFANIALKLISVFVPLGTDTSLIRDDMFEESFSQSIGEVSKGIFYRKVRQQVAKIAKG